MSKPQFGFTVDRIETWNDDDQPGWTVTLPHQCDRWRIDADTSYHNASTRQTALYSLDAFIAEAQQARAALAAGQEYPPKEQQ